MVDNKTQIDVFISYKSADSELAKELYHFLQTKQLSVFLSSETLPQLGSSDYRKAIDKALDECNHLIVVGSKVDHITSSWVEAEWGFYISEKRAGRKRGNILTVVTENIEIKDLPASLRYFEVIFFKKENFDRIAAYVGKGYQDPVYKSKRRFTLKSKWLLPGISLVVLAAALWYYLGEKNKPFSASVFVRPDASLKLNANYPTFEGGELSLFMGSKEDRRRILPSQSTTFQQIPVAFEGKKISASLRAPHWKLMSDTILLENKPIYLSIVPDGSLSTLYGNVKDLHGNGIGGCVIGIDSDTTTQTDGAGNFKITLPYQMQKGRYVLFVSKPSFHNQKIDYFPGSGNVDIVLRSLLHAKPMTD